MILNLSNYTDISLLLLRLMAALVFLASGKSHIQDPAARSKSIGMSKSFTVFLGIAEIAGGLGIALGILTQFAAIGLILLMFGAIFKKAFLWKTGFWGEKESGWHYDLILVLINLVILTTGGGRLLLVN